jgi:hypothetical protein
VADGSGSASEGVENVYALRARELLSEMKVAYPVFFDALENLVCHELESEASTTSGDDGMHAPCKLERIIRGLQRGINSTFKFKVIPIVFRAPGSAELWPMAAFRKLGLLIYKTFFQSLTDAESPSHSATGGERLAEFDVGSGARLTVHGTFCTELGKLPPVVL